METMPSKSSDLARVAAACKKHLSDSAVGPLLAAVELQPIIEGWDSYKLAAGDVTPNQWLSKAICTNGSGGTKGSWVRFFAERYEAVTLLGRDSMRNIHHELAVWLVGQLGHGRMTDLEWAKVKRELFSATKRRGVPLTPAEGKRLVTATLGRKMKLRQYTCRRCQELEAKLREAGIEV